MGRRQRETEPWLRECGSWPEDIWGTGVEIAGIVVRMHVTVL